MGLLKSQNSVNINLLAEGTLLNFLAPRNDVFQLHDLMFARRFSVVQACSISCDNLLQERLYSFMIIAARIACMFPHLPVCAHL